jgi:hypothetical protein
MAQCEVNVSMAGMGSVAHQAVGKRSSELL